MKKTTTLIIALFISISAHATTFGLPSIVKCPKCKCQLAEPSLTSGNNFGATVWSDGFVDAPMMPSIPFIVKCPECREIFFTKENYSEREAPYEKVKNMRSTTECQLEFADFEKAIGMITDHENEMPGTREERRKLAYMMAWRSYNDYYRKNEPEKAEKQKDVFRTYASELLPMLSDENKNESVFKAELYRELGEFDRCIGILDGIKLEKLKWVTSLIRSKAENGETEVFKLKN